MDYWDELVALIDWSRKNVWSTMHICWGAQAGLYHHYGIKKYPLKEKMFGLFHHRALDLKDPLLRGFDEVFLAPHSRHTEVRREDIEAERRAQAPRRLGRGGRLHRGLAGRPRGLRDRAIPSTIA